MAEMESHYPPGKPGLVRRDAHAKAHGCAKGVFPVDSTLPPELRVGTFATPAREMKAWVRFSNGAFHPGPDTGMDGRGMAVKIFASAPATTAGATQAPVHDILMINHPVFFSNDAADYKDFATAGALNRGHRRS